MHAETDSVGKEKEAVMGWPGFVDFREEVKGWCVRLVINQKGCVFLG